MTPRPDLTFARLEEIKASVAEVKAAMVKDAMVKGATRDPSLAKQLGAMLDQLLKELVEPEGRTPIQSVGIRDES